MIASFHSSARKVNLFLLIAIFLFASVFSPSVAFAEGNTKIYSYSAAKRFLYGDIYSDHRVTVYCGAQFDENRNITLPQGFVIATHEDRAYRAETEHIVAAENFGRAFVEWREGSPQCVDNRGFPFRGRKCAETNPEFQRMEADLHNLAPAIGAVNAARRNFRFGMLTSSDFDWGACPLKISGRSV